MDIGHVVIVLISCKQYVKTGEGKVVPVM